nr:DUF1573 domain-containing protein [Bacteroidales bacterium]
MKKCYIHFLEMILFLVYFGCSSQPNYAEFYNSELSEIIESARNTNSFLCVVIGEQSILKEIDYVGLFKNHAQNCNKNIIINYVDISLNENIWYQKTFTPQLYPITCIFNPHGVLIDVVPGNSIESFGYILKSINNNSTSKDFHYNQLYGDEKSEKIQYINQLITIKTKIDKNIDVTSDINSLLMIERHPYVLYFKIQEGLRNKDTIRARDAAMELVKFTCVDDLITYHNEIVYANNIIDSCYNNNAPVLIVKPMLNSQISLLKNETHCIDLILENIGQQDLIVYDIFTSCSCLKVLSQTSFIIKNNSSKTIRLQLESDGNVGYLERFLYISSNSIDTPLTEYKICATIKSDSYE